MVQFAHPDLVNFTIVGQFIHLLFIALYAPILGSNLPSHVKAKMHFVTSFIIILLSIYFMNDKRYP